MYYLEDLFHRKIRVTDERRKHIESDHPEMFGEDEKIADCLSSPEKVRLSKTDETVSLYYRFFDNTSVGSKYLCAVVKNSGEDLFLITAYFTDKVKEGEALYG